MARPRKKTLDFFIWERDQSQDPRISAIHRCHGAEGIGVYILLLERACRADELRFSLSDDLILDALKPVRI